METNSPQSNEELLIAAMHDLMEAEAQYRSAMSIYRNHPGHQTRISAESHWHHAKTVAKVLLAKIDREKRRTVAPTFCKWPECPRGDEHPPRGRCDCSLT